MHHDDSSPPRQKHEAEKAKVTRCEELGVCQGLKLCKNCPRLQAQKMARTPSNEYHFE